MKKSEKSYKEYVPRDVSWMFFNYRILQEAEKKNVPLLERLGFLGIYSILMSFFACVWHCSTA